MKWLVCINDEGIQCKIPVGSDVDKAAREQKDLRKYAKIMFVFEESKSPYDVRGGDSEDYLNFLSKKTSELHKRHGAAEPSEFFGYQMRKRAALGSGIEVLADLDAKDYEQFSKKYSGIDGAIDVLYNTEKVMSGVKKDPAKAVSKLIRKLEIEAEG